MNLPVHISISRMKSGANLLLLLGLSGLLIGCANPGPPHPPSLHLPKVVTDLQAERVGDAVKLRWTSPDQTTDDISITRPITAQVCRAVGTADCSPVNTIPVKSGASESADLLPSTLTAGAPTLIGYRVTILNNRQHSAGPSAPAWVAAGPAPAFVSGLHIQATEQGAMLQWAPSDTTDWIELDRTHIVPPTKTAPSQQELKAQKERSPLQPVAKEPAEMHLRSAKADTPHADAGGTLDATARSGETYIYTAQRVREVALQGHKLQIRSTPSPAITIVMRDTFPPRPPAGLDAILSGQTAPAIDLSWRPNIERDLDGYLVYRQELGPNEAILGGPAKLTPKPIVEPGFHDASVTTGHLYRYTVTAVDTSGNESAASAPTQEEVRQP